jgi:hypothetical protein
LEVELTKLSRIANLFDGPRSSGSLAVRRTCLRSCCSSRLIRVRSSVSVFATSQTWLRLQRAVSCRSAPSSCGRVRLGASRCDRPRRAWPSVCASRCVIDMSSCLGGRARQSSRAVGEAEVPNPSGHVVKPAGAGTAQVEIAREGAGHRRRGQRRRGGERCDCRRADLQRGGGVEPGHAEEHGMWAASRPRRDPPYPNPNPDPAPSPSPT